MSDNVSQDIVNYQSFLKYATLKGPEETGKNFKDFEKKSDATLKSAVVYDVSNYTNLQSTDTTYIPTFEGSLQGTLVDEKTFIPPEIILATVSTKNFAGQLVSSAQPEPPENKAKTFDLFSRPKDMQKSDNFFENISNWEKTNQAKALLDLGKPVQATVTNEYGRVYTETYFAGIDTKLGQLESSRNNLASANTLANSIDTLFELKKNPLTKNVNQLYQSQVLSYEKYLKNLDARVDPHDNNQTWKEFFKEVFNKETAKEIGNVFLDAATSFGLGIAKSLIPSFKTKPKDNKGIGDVGDIKYKNSDDIKDIEFIPIEYYDFKSSVEYLDSKDKATDEIDLSTLKGLLNIDETTTEKEIKDVEGIEETAIVKSTTGAIANLFKSIIATNPLLGQHQFMFRIGNSKAESLVAFNNTVTPELYFRVQNISVPEYKRKSTNVIYGHSGNSLLVSSQASAMHRAEMDIVCDRNLHILEYLIRLSGLGVCNSGETTSLKSARTYNLSTVSNADHNLSATLRILNGRDLTKEFFMENPDWDFSKEPPGKVLSKLSTSLVSQQSTVAYADLPVFTFKNFKIVNLDYNFKFDSSKTDASLLTIKATVTWSQMNVLWESTKDFYSMKVKEAEN